MALDVTKSLGALIDASLHDLDNDNSEAEMVLGHEHDEIMFNVSNTGANLTGFALLVKATKDVNTWHTILTTTGWDSVAGNLIEVVGTLKTLGTGASGYAHVRVGFVYAIKFQASIASGARSAGTFTAAANPTNTAAAQDLVINTSENIVADEVVVIDGVTYTVVAALTEDEGDAVPFEVLEGATGNDTLDNLAAAINGDAGEGTLYGTGTTPHTTVNATVDTLTLTATALTPGTGGNAIEVTTDATEAAWGAGTLEGGTTETVTVDTTVYTFKAAGFVNSANDVLIGVDADATLFNFVSAMNAAAGEGTLYGTGTVAQTRVDAAEGAGDTVVITAKSHISAAVGTLIVTTETCAQCSFGATTLADGVTTAIAVNCIAK